MKKLLVMTMGLLLLALPALVCESGASGNGGAGNTTAAGAGCPIVKPVSPQEVDT